MPLNKSRGNMYPWVTHTHAHLAGRCPHGCQYCYVESRRFGRPVRYEGPLRLREDELMVDYGRARTIFVEHMNDLFAEDVELPWLRRILSHCSAFPENCYVFQTKNPDRAFRSLVHDADVWPRFWMLGTTIESNRWYDVMGKAPAPAARASAMIAIRALLPAAQLFITIEPVLKFDESKLVSWVIDIAPQFVNIGADSKGHSLSEPAGDEVLCLIKAIERVGVEVRGKHNLRRLTWAREAGGQR